MSDSIKSEVQKLNASRLSLLKMGRKKDALNVQRAMMQADRDEAHKLINASRAKAPKVSNDGVYGRYRSRSGEDIKDVVDAIPAFEPRKKKRTVVTSPHKAVLTHITEKAYAELNDMDDAQLDDLFGMTAVERQWLEEEGAPINPKANAKTVRRKTRKVLEAGASAEAAKVEAKDLKDMTRDELDEAAKAKGIDPDVLSTKADVIAAIKGDEDDTLK